MRESSTGSKIYSSILSLEESKDSIQVRKLKKVGDKKGGKRYKRKYTFKSGAVYDGEWIGGIRDGFGCQTWPDGAKYTGEWRDDKANGRGTFVHVSGDVYEGEFLNDKANGYGIYTHVNGSSYRG